MLTFIIHMRVKPGHAPEMEAILGEFCGEVRKNEPDVVYFDFARSIDVPNTYVVVEVYRGAAARHAHSQTPWLKAALARAAAITIGEPEVREYLRAEG